MADTGERKALSEGESRELLKSFGLPLAPWGIARTAEEAGELSAGFGFPAVAKGHGEGLAHKSELGLVRLNLPDRQAVTDAAAEMLERGVPGLDGVMVSPQLSGRREFVVGFFRDPVFGPVVMFGLGGVFTEALKDVVFRVAPLTDSDADSMLSEIRSAALLGPFRGESSADREALKGALLSLSRLSVERPDILEVDVNPLLVTPEGKVFALDALVVAGHCARCEDPPRRAIPTADLAAFFHPKSVAFVGASGVFGKWGMRLPLNLLAGGFEGGCHFVNPKGGKLWGRPVYRSVEEIPGEVDLAVVTIPAEGVAALLPSFKAKGIRRMLLITSGFGETGEEGRALEKELVEEAERAGVLIFGPNTMGILNPHQKLFLTGVLTHVAPGETTLVSQSGNMGVQLLEFAAGQGIGIRAFAGSGNEAMISVEDFMESFEADRATTTVLLYVESVKDGARFFRAAKRVGKVKPVILLKGGRTEAGSRAAESHTGAMASNYRVFEAACNQAGIVTVEKPTEMLEVSAAFSSLPLPRGRRVAIVTLGGGWGVVTSDLCADRGLVVNPLPPEIIACFDKVLPPYWSRTNPVDLVGENDPELPLKALRILGEWEGCDAILNLGLFGRSHLLNAVVDSAIKVDRDFSGPMAAELARLGQVYEDDFLESVLSTMEEFQKPVIGVNLASGGSSKAVYEVPGRKYKGVFFNSPERAVNALSHMCRYRDYLNR